MVGMNLLFQFLTILFAANTVLGTNMIILNNSFTRGKYLRDVRIFVIIDLKLVTIWPQM